MIVPLKMNEKKELKEKVSKKNLKKKRQQRDGYNHHFALRIFLILGKKNPLLFVETFKIPF